jgi:glycoside/pentoside/hexuronide:cation symporter, GPH family
VSERLSLKTKLGYGICDLGGNLFFTIVGFYLLYFLTDVMGLNAGLAGTALFVGKFWDAVTDPAVGYLSDRTRSSMGRRRPFMLWGAFGLLVSMTILFTNPGFKSQGLLFVWALLAYCLVDVAYTAVNIPYGALLPEITTDFNERTALNGYRMSFAVVGTLVGVAIVLPIVGLFHNPTVGWAVMGASMGAVMMAVTLVTFAAVHEDPSRQAAEQDKGIVRSSLEALGSRVFLLALIPWVLHIAGVTVIQSVMVYYFKYIYEAEGQFQIAMVILLVTALLFIPVWVVISRRIGKKLSYNLGMGLFAAAVLAFFVFGERAGLTFAYVIMAIGGVGLSTNYVMPFSLVPDVVEYDYAETGRRREGVYYGLWTLASKIGQGLVLGLSGWMLAAFGYVKNQPQTAPAKLGIGLLVGPIPALLFVAGVVVLSFYPINRRFYEEILEKVKRRQAQAGSARG